MTDFQIGDRVLYKGFGKGTVIYIEESTDDKPLNVLIEFDNTRKGLHSGSGMGKPYSCYWIHSDNTELKLISNAYKEGIIYD